MITQTLSIGRIAEKHTAGTIEAQFLKRHTGKRYTVLIEAGLDDMATRQFQRISINIRAADPGNLFRCDFRKRFLPDFEQPVLISKTQILHRKMPIKSW